MGMCGIEGTRWGVGNLARRPVECACRMGLAEMLNLQLRLSWTASESGSAPPSLVDMVNRCASA